MAEPRVGDQVDELAQLIEPVPVLDFTTVVCRWLQDAHEAAAELQPVRRASPRGGWDNNTSFGTDRYQYLRATAPSLMAELPGLEVDSSFQSVLLKLGRVGIYQLQSASGPHGSLAGASDLRRELLTTNGDEALISRRDIWLAGRELLFLLWNGTEEHGLTGAWAGQGELFDNHIEWSWYVRLQDINAGIDLPAPAEPLDPTIFDLPAPEVPMRPRSRRSTG